MDSLAERAEQAIKRGCDFVPLTEAERTELAGAWSVVWMIPVEPLTDVEHTETSRSVSDMPTREAKIVEIRPGRLAGLRAGGLALDVRPFKGPNVISHLQAIELAYRGDTWVRPLSWRGNGSIVSCIFDTLVIGPAPNIRPTDGKFAMDEGWEIVKPADLAREAQASDR